MHSGQDLEEGESFCFSTHHFTQEGSGLCCQRSLWFFCLLGMEEEEGMTKTGAIFLLSIECVGTEGELTEQEDVYSGDDVQTHECEVGEGTWAGGCEET